MSGSTRVLWRRAIAHALDGLIPLVVALGLAALTVQDETGAIVVLYVVLVLGLLGEFIVLQGLTGYTPGKWLLGIRVVTANGQPPGIAAAIKRTIPLLFELYGLVAIYAIWSHPHGQRFGDRWAGTYVVRAHRGELPQPAGVPA